MNKKESKLRSSKDYEGHVKVNGDVYDSHIHSPADEPAGSKVVQKALANRENSVRYNSPAVHNDSLVSSNAEHNVESFRSNSQGLNVSEQTNNNQMNHYKDGNLSDNPSFYSASGISQEHNQDSVAKYTVNGQQEAFLNHGREGAHDYVTSPGSENSMFNDNPGEHFHEAHIRISDGYVQREDTQLQEKSVNYHYSETDYSPHSDHIKAENDNVNGMEKIRVFSCEKNPTSANEVSNKVLLEQKTKDLYVEQGPHSDALSEADQIVEKPLSKYSYESRSEIYSLREDFDISHELSHTNTQTSDYKDNIFHSKHEIGGDNNRSLGDLVDGASKTVIRKTKEGFVVEQEYEGKTPQSDKYGIDTDKPLSEQSSQRKTDNLKIDTKEKAIREKITGDGFTRDEDAGFGEKPSKIRISEKTKLKVKEVSEAEDFTDISFAPNKGKRDPANRSLFGRLKNPYSDKGSIGGAGKSTGNDIFQKALSVGLAGGIVVGAIGGTQMMINSTFLWVPNAAHYYTDGTPQDGEAEAENKEAIRNGKVNYFSFTSADGEEEKILITQSAVNAMAELQSSYEESAFDVSELEELECIEISENGVLIDPSRLSGKSYMDYTGSYIATGIPLNEDQISLSAPKRPNFVSVPADKRGSVRIEIKYFNDNSASIRYYYPYTSSNVTQYLGNLNFVKDGAYIAGWSTQKDSSEITFKTYQKLDAATMTSLVNMSDNGNEPILLYPVWVDNNISTKTVDIGVVTEEDIAGDLAGTFTEKDLSIQYAYVDEGGNVQYTVEDTDTTYTYSRDELFKAILAMATVATENSIANPDVYISYCVSLLEEAIKGYKGYSVTYSAREIPNSLGTDYGFSWTENGVEYVANGAKLTCNVTIFVNPSIESMMASDKTTADWFISQGLTESKFEGWTDSNKEWARSYMKLSVDDFIEFFQVAFPAQAAYMSGYDNASVIFNMLVGRGYSTAAALGILANLMQESGLDPTAFNSIGMVGIMQTFQKRLDDFAALQGEAWPNVSLTTQVEFIIYECEQTNNYTSSYSYGSSYLDDYVDKYGLDYCYMPIEDFKKITDIEQATVAFCASYEKPQLWEANMKQRIEYAFDFADRIVYGNSSGAQGYISWAVSIAEDDTHGYSMARRTGPDYDCSSFVYYALLNGGYPEIETYYSYPFTVDYIASTLINMGFTIIPYSYDSLVAGDILISAGDAHTEIYIGDNQLVGAHGCEPSASHPGRSPQTGDQDGTELSVCAFFDLEEQPWVTIVRPPMGGSRSTTTQNGVLQSNHHVSFYSQKTTTGEEDYSNSSERYNSGILCAGQAATSDPDLPIGTVIYVVTTASGISSAANGKYYIITDLIDEDEAKYNSDYIIRLFHEVVSSNSENMKAPYGSSTTAKVYKVDTDVTWDEFLTTYGG